MAVVYLVRHAQAEDAGRGARDHDRPLDGAGQAAARRVGRALAARAVAPDLVLCSSARRAQETWACMARELPAAPAPLAEDALYLATAASLLERLAALPQGCLAPLLVGHNPGLYQLLRALLADGAPETAATLATGLPPGAAAAVEVAGDWPGLAAGRGRLLWLVVPETAP